jgi:acyl carrier protein
MDALDRDIRAILREYARLGVDVDDLDADADLFATGMTSFASVNVMLALEEAFDFEFPDSMLNRGVFVSIASIRQALLDLRVSMR